MLSTKDLVLDIASNLGRLGNWGGAGYGQRRGRIIQFLEETDHQVRQLGERPLSEDFSSTFKSFRKEFSRLGKEGREGPKNPSFWAEDLFTWANILTHRSKLLN